MLRIFEKINELIKIVIYYRTKYHFNYLIKEDQPKFVISLYSCPQKLVKNKINQTCTCYTCPHRQYHAESNYKQIVHRQIENSECKGH